MQILGISGSLRGCSFNSALLRAAGSVLPAGVGFREWSGLAEVPAYNEDIPVTPASVVTLKSALAEADAVLFATPEYNASVPGALKNALDWASRPFHANPLRGKPVAVVGASQGVFGALWAQAELRKVLQTIGAQVDDRELVVARAQDAFDERGSLRDPALEASLHAIVCGLVNARCRRAA
jgi:chromate reductase, NAD(P)H dehydrogenase (quinone)